MDVYKGKDKRDRARGKDKRTIRAGNDKQAVVECSEAVRARGP